jgi:Cd2+/Zn2+-exporting ATPase
MIDCFSARYAPIATGMPLLHNRAASFFGAGWIWFYRGLVTLLIACPCALLLSTPAAIAPGLASFTRQGSRYKRRGKRRRR